VFGFPVDTTNLELPQANLASTVVSMPPNDRDLQHSGVVAGGSSGSPIFNLDGRVIAVHSGAQGDAYDGKATPFAHAVPVHCLTKLLKSPRWADIPQ